MGFNVLRCWAYILGTDCNKLLKLTICEKGGRGQQTTTTTTTATTKQQQKTGRSRFSFSTCHHVRTAFRCLLLVKNNNLVIVSRFKSVAHFINDSVHVRTASRCLLLVKRSVVIVSRFKSVAHFISDTVCKIPLGVSLSGLAVVI